MGTKGTGKEAIYVTSTQNITLINAQPMKTN